MVALSAIRSVGLFSFPSVSVKHKPAIHTYIQPREEKRGRRKRHHHNTAIRELRRRKEGGRERGRLEA